MSARQESQCVDYVKGCTSNDYPKDGRVSFIVSLFGHVTIITITDYAKTMVVLSESQCHLWLLSFSVVINVISKYFTEKWLVTSYFHIEVK